MIIINNIILYFKHITHTDDFPLNGYLACYVIINNFVLKECDVVRVMGDSVTVDVDQYYHHPYQMYLYLREGAP